MAYALVSAVVTTPRERQTLPSGGGGGRAGIYYLVVRKPSQEHRRRRSEPKAAKRGKHCFSLATGSTSGPRQHRGSPWQQTTFDRRAPSIVHQLFPGQCHVFLIHPCAACDHLWLASLSSYWGRLTCKYNSNYYL